MAHFDTVDDATLIAETERLVGAAAETPTDERILAQVLDRVLREGLDRGAGGSRRHWQTYLFAGLAAAIPVAAAAALLLTLGTRHPFVARQSPAGQHPETPQVVQQGMTAQLGGRQPSQLRGIRVFPDGTGWGMDSSDGGDLVVRTADGGRTWRSVEPPGDPGVDAWTFLDSRTAYFAGRGPLLAAADGGVPSAPTTPGRGGFGAWGKADTHQIMVFATSDGGRTWTSAPIADGLLTQSFQTSDLEFADDQHGWLLVSYSPIFSSLANREHRLYATTDGGRTWARLAMPGKTGAVDQCDNVGISPDAFLVGWLATACRGELDLYRTSDWGAGWTRVSMPAVPGYTGGHDPATSCYLAAPTVGAAGLVYTTGGCGLGSAFLLQAQSALFVSTNGGLTFTAHSIPKPGLVHLSDSTHGWLFGDSNAGPNRGPYAQTTADGGRTWQPADPQPRFANDINRNFAFDDATHWWVLDYIDADGPQTTFGTSDGGHTWYDLHPKLP